MRLPPFFDPLRRSRGWGNGRALNALLRSDLPVLRAIGRRFAKGHAALELGAEGGAVRVPQRYSPHGGQIWALYDVDLVRLAAVWRGPFPEGVVIAGYSYHNTKKKADGGQKAVPRVEGEPLFSTPMLPGMWIYIKSLK